MNGQHVVMLKRHSKPDMAVPKLWCVELVPKGLRLTDADKEKALELAKGIPRDPKGALRRMAQVVGGLADHRDPRFLRVRQRLVVFTERKKALEKAKKEGNEFWSAHVRPVVVV
jgi:hypothetical protein